MKKVKRFLAVILALSLSLSVVFFTPVIAEAYDTNYPNTWVNTGNQIDDLIGVAMTQVGYHGVEYVSGTKYGAWYGNTLAPWCGMFISWCAAQAGIPTSVIIRSASAKDFRNCGTYHFKDGYSPQRGDILLYNPTSGSGYYWPSIGSDGKYSKVSHVAIVTGYDKATDMVSIVHGNATGDKVCSSVRKKSEAYIQAFVTPPYTTGPSASIDHSHITGSDVRFRSSPDTSVSDNIIGILSNGTLIDVLSKEGDWYKITVCSSGKTGYVYADYVTVVEQTPTPPPVTHNNSYINGSGVFLRSSANKTNNENVLTALALNTEVKVLEKVDSWYKVTVISTGETGFVASEYVTVVGDVPSAPQVKNSYINGSDVRFRSSPNTGSGNIIKTFAVNTEVDVLEKLDGWYKVKLIATGEEGYVSADYVTVIEKPAEPPATPTAPQGSYINGDGVRLRETPDGNILGSYEANTEVELLGNAKPASGIWYKVKIKKDGVIGYVFGEYVTLHETPLNFRYDINEPADKTVFRLSSNTAVSVRGWAFADNNGAADIEVSFDGKAPTSLAKVLRTDVKNAYPTVCTTDDCGFGQAFPISGFSLGEHTLTLTAVCKAERKVIAERKFSVVDDVPPTGTAPTVLSSDDKGFTLSAAATDNVSLSKIEFSVSLNGVIKTYAGALIGGTYSVTVPYSDFSEPFGTFKASVMAFDNSGNKTVLGEVSHTTRPKEKYTISFDANGGDNPPEAVIKTEGEDVILPAGKPVRDGFTFIGWNTDKLASTARYFPNSAFSLDGNMTLYAIWKDGSTCLLGDVNNDGSVDALDLSRLKKKLVDSSVWVSEFADINSSGSIDATDLILLKKFLSGQVVF